MDIKNNEITVVIIPDSAYGKDIIKVARQLAEASSSICYVSLNKPHNSLVKNFENSKIDKGKFLFLDAVTKSYGQEAGGAGNCIFISSIMALTELSIAISKVLEEKKFESLMFDSLSTMLIYHDAGTVTKFVYSIIVRARAANCTAVFTCLEGDSKSALIKDLGMFVDSIISMPN